MVNSSLRPSPSSLGVAFAIRIAPSGSLLMARAGGRLGSSHFARSWTSLERGLGADVPYVPLDPGLNDLHTWLEGANPFKTTCPGALSMAGVDFWRG